MRHKDAKTTQIYADHLSGDDEAAVVEAAFAVESYRSPAPSALASAPIERSQSFLVEVLNGDRSRTASAAEPERDGADPDRVLASGLV